MIRSVVQSQYCFFLLCAGLFGCASRNGNSEGGGSGPDGSSSAEAGADGGVTPPSTDGGVDAPPYIWPDAGCSEAGTPANTFPGLPTAAGWSALPVTTCLMTSPPDSNADNQCPPNGFGGSSYAFHDMCGGMFANDTGGFADTYRSFMYLFGGGHNNYAGNELYRLDLSQPSNGLALLRVTDPTVPTAADGPFYDSESGCIGALPPDETVTSYAIQSIKRDGSGTATAVLGGSTVFVPHNRGLFGKASVQITGVTVDSSLNEVVEVNSVATTNASNDTITFNAEGAAVSGAGGTASTTWSACTGPGCKPNARHTPGSTSLYVPPPVDRLFTAGGDSACGAGDPDPDAWTAPLACLNNDTPWTRIAETNPSYDPPLSNGGVAFGAHGLGWFFINEYDPNTGLVWTSDLWSLYTYDFATNLFSLKSAPGGFTLSQNLQGAVDPAKKVLVAAGGCRTFPITSIQRTSGTVSLTYDITQPAYTALGPRTDEFLVANAIFVSGVSDPSYDSVGMPLFSAATAATPSATTATITYSDGRPDAAVSSGGLAYSCDPNDSGAGGVGGFYAADISDATATSIAQQNWTVASITDATPLTDPITGMTTASGITCANFLAGGGANHLYPSTASQCPGLTYDSTRQELIGWPNQGSAVYVLVPHPEMSPPRIQCYTEDYGGSLPVNSLSETGVPNMSNGTHGRFQYFPGPDIFLLMNSYRLPAYVLRRK
jgi:hypothetical protein